MSGVTFFGKTELSKENFESFTYLDKSRHKFSKLHPNAGIRYFCKFLDRMEINEQRAKKIYLLVLDRLIFQDVPYTSNEGRKWFFSEGGRHCSSYYRKRAIKTYLGNIGINLDRLREGRGRHGYRIIRESRDQTVTLRYLPERTYTILKAGCALIGFLGTGAILYTLFRGGVKVPLDRISIPGHVTVGGGHFGNSSMIASKAITLNNRSVKLDNRNIVNLKTLKTQNGRVRNGIIIRCEAGEGNSDRDPDRAGWGSYSNKPEFNRPPQVSSSKKKFVEKVTEYWESPDGQVMKEFGLSVGSFAMGDMAGGIEHGMEGLRIQTEQVWESSKELFDYAKDFFSRD